MSSDVYLSPKNYKEIGMLVYKVHPDLAINILSIIGNTVPHLEDMDLIPALLQKYCDHENITPGDLNGSKQSHMHFKYVFIASMIKLYNPQILSGIHCSRLKNKLREKIAVTLKIKPVWLSQIIPVINTRLRVYDEFLFEVNSFVSVVKNNYRQDVIS